MTHYGVQVVRGPVGAYLRTSSQDHQTGFEEENFSPRSANGKRAVVRLKIILQVSIYVLFKTETHFPLIVKQPVEKSVAENVPSYSLHETVISTSSVGLSVSRTSWIVKNVFKGPKMFGIIRSAIDYHDHMMDTYGGSKMVFGIVGSAIRYHDYIMDTYGDPRTKDWMFMSGPLPTIALCLGYVFIVKYLGPKLMENRKPFELKKTMIVYNAFLVALSGWMVYEGLVCGWLNGYSFKCQPCDFSNTPTALRMARAVWWYYFSKFIEFLDTFFFVLRKKDNQISTLHVIHHAIMPFSTWPGVKFYPGGHITFSGTLNSFVHVIMYSYYLLAAFGPGIQKYLWWKKYLTTLQIVQFVIIFYHSMQLFFIDCTVPIAFGWSIVFHAVLFFVLFRRFYNEAYVDDKSKTKTAMEKMNMCMPGLPSNDDSKDR